MANVMKHSKSACGHLSKHYERSRDANDNYIKFGNQNINLELTHLNYNLAPEHELNQNDFIKI